MSNKANDPKWRQRQMRLFTNFCNAKLCEREDVPPVTNLFEDMKDGKLLYALLEELSGQSLAPVGRIKRLRAGKTATRIDNVANLSICFRYIKQTTKIVGIGPGDIADGNETMVLGMLWSLIVFFTAKDLGGVDDLTALKKKLLRWAQRRTAHRPEVGVGNLKASFADGRAFLAILEGADPRRSPFAPADDARANFRVAFADAKARYGVPDLLDGGDSECWKDDATMVLYLSELMRRVPEPAPDDAGAVFRAVDAGAADGAAALEALCGFRTAPDDAAARAACAAAIERVADAAKLDSEIFDVGGAPWVRVQARGLGKDRPTLLALCDFGLDAGAPWTAPRRAGAAILAVGARSAKAGVAAPLAALGAVVAAGADFGSNVDLLCACGGGDADAIAAALASIYGSAPPPATVLVDAPDSGESGFVAAFSCRGVVEADVAVSAGPAAGDAAAAVGPCRDANALLCGVLRAVVGTVPGVSVDAVGQTADRVASSFPATASASLRVDLAPDADARAAAAGLEAAVDAAAAAQRATATVAVGRAERGYVSEPAAARDAAAAAAAHFPTAAAAPSPHYLPLAAGAARAFPGAAVVALGAADARGGDGGGAEERVALNDHAAAIKTLAALFL